MPKYFFIMKQEKIGLIMVGNLNSVALPVGKNEITNGNW